MDGEEGSVVPCILERVNETDQGLHSVGTQGGGGAHHDHRLKGGKITFVILCTTMLEGGDTRQ